MITGRSVLGKPSHFRQLGRCELRFFLVSGVTGSSDSPGIYSPTDPSYRFGFELGFNSVSLLEVMGLQGRKKDYDKRHNGCAPAGLPGCGLCL